MKQLLDGHFFVASSTMNKDKEKLVLNPFVNLCVTAKNSAFVKFRFKLFCKYERSWAKNYAPTNILPEKGSFWAAIIQIVKFNSFFFIL